MHGVGHLPAMRGNVQGIAWPPLVSGPCAGLVALLHQLEASQWQSAEETVRQQYRQLGLLAEYAEAKSPYFRDRLRAAGLRPADLATPDGLRRLPPLRRRDIQAAGTALFCSEVPSRHLPVGETRTSGSTGEPVVVRKTGIDQVFYLAFSLRDHFWHGRDFGKRAAGVTARISRYEEASHWGPPVSLLFASGPAQGIPITTGIDAQLEQLERFRPSYLVTYPSNLAGIVQACLRRGRSIDGLEHVQTIGETLPASIRDLAAAVLGVRVADSYSSEEFGKIAIECPHSGLYHVMAENLIVEVLAQDGSACADGEVGRVVVSDLHNYATPLIRYDIGDYAEAASECPCGRSLPTLRRIVGRERNLIVMPDGSRHWPLVGFARFREVAPVVQYQLIQDGRESIEVRMVCERPLTPAQEAGLSQVIRQALGFPFDLRFSYFPDRLPGGAGGKFEEFICRLPAQPVPSPAATCPRTTTYASASGRPAAASGYARGCG